MELTSEAFSNGGIISARYTCDGEDISPTLLIKEPPAATNTFALIMEDPDVPRSIRSDGLWVHWVVWNIKGDTRRIPEGKIIGVEGINTGGKKGYMGPCPPDGEHRYFFCLYALDVAFNLPSNAGKSELMMAMDGHIIAEAELMGRYSRAQ